MSFEEEFDRKIRLKAEEADYAFDPGNWEKASRMIDADRKLGSMARMAKFYLPAIVLGVAALAYLLYNTSTANDQQLTLTKQSPDLISQNHTTAGSPQAITHPTSLAPDETMVSSTKDADQTGNNRHPDKSQALRSDKSKADRAILPRTMATNLEETLEQSIVPAAAASVPSSGLNSSTVESQVNTQSNNGNNNGNEDVETSVNSGNKALVEEAAVVKTGPDKQSVTEIQAMPSGANQIEQNEVAVSAESVTESSDDKQFLLNRVSVFQPAEEGVLIAVPLVMLPIYDEDYYKSTRNYNTHFFNLEMGAEYNLGWESTNGRDGKGINWFGGCNYGYSINKRFVLGAGLQAYNIQNTNQAFYEVSKKEYSFGSVTGGTVITNRNLFYIAIPVKLYYSLNEYNQIGVGANAAYLMSARSEVQTYDVLDNARIHVINSRNTGVYEGTGRVNVLLSAFYRTQLKKRLALNAEFVFGLNDIFKNSYAIKVNERPIGLRLGLQYTLFTK